MKKLSPRYIKLSLVAQKTVLEDLYQRRHIEACGIFTGTIDEQGNWHIEQAYPLTNTAHSPVYFEFDPAELLLAELDHPGQIIGVYHSHPTGFAMASTTDRDNMKRVNKEQQIPWAWLIIRGPFDEAWHQHHATNLPQEALVAYYHYPNGGLQKLLIAEEIQREQSDTENTL